ncbi:MAG: ATP-binding protein [Spirulina sp. SIO3F2]|nr:ATP-binding protein [Spirulina sp. SIO3F2]
MPTTPLDWYAQNQQTLQQELARITALLEHYLDSAKALPSEVNEIPSSSALAQLCQKFNLNAFERDLLLLCVGAEINPKITRLCAQAQGDPSLTTPTLGLALALFATPQWSSLSPQSPLHRWHLVGLAPHTQLVQAPLKLDRRVLCYLLGELAIDESLKPYVRHTPKHSTQPTSLPASQAQIVEGIIGAWQIIPAGQFLPLIQLCGYQKQAKNAIAQAVGDQLNFRLLHLTIHNLPTSADDLATLATHWDREAFLSDAILAVDVPELGDRDRRATSLQFLESLQAPLMLNTETRQAFLERTTLTFDLGPLPHPEKRELWERYLGDRAAEIQNQLEPIIAQFNLERHTIQSACAALHSTPTEALPTQLWDYCRSQARPHLEHLAQRIDCTATWEELILPEREKTILHTIAQQVKQRAKVYETWGFGRKSARGLGISALFAGPSGTGKTMAAEVLAREFNLDLYRIDLSAVSSKYIGETEKNLRQIFDAAEAGGAVLLFDEADALFGKRTQVKDSHDRHANLEVSYLLQRMEAYQGLAILTTNLKDSLDQAFIRRLRFILNFPYPQQDTRSEIWAQIFPSQTPTEGLDYELLGQLDMAGGNIRSIALNSAFIAADADEPVMMKHILTAAQSECAKIGRSLSKEETKYWF